jgi:hypothetical protein
MRGTERALGGLLAADLLHEARHWSSSSSAPVVTIGVMIVSIWYFGWARHTVEGRIRTVDEDPPPVALPSR